jgi:squalene-hopene/tetraprenyl-beta-curcumene cyclase
LTIRRASFVWATLATSLVAALIAACSHSGTRTTNSANEYQDYPAATTKSATPAVHLTTWNPKAAATYLDQRETWWIGWDAAKRDHQTYCVSCHTVVPYVLSRPALRASLAETGPSPNERALIENVTKRVRNWQEMLPFYSDEKYGAHKAVESRSTESVLDALIMVSHDTESGHLSVDARTALDNMWALQLTSGDNEGAWHWQVFNLEPWESTDSQYWGATLAAIAVGMAPDDYRSTPAIQNNIALLRDYLNREYPRQSSLNRVFLLLASAKFPGLIPPDRRQEIINEALDKQQADGGWRLASLASTWRGWSFWSVYASWNRADGSKQDPGSDGFATGLVAFTLEEAGVPRDNAQLKKGLGWLQQNQDQSEGLWRTASINKQRLPNSNAGLFMSDAATAYAVLALTDATTKEQSQQKVAALQPAR